MEKFRQFLEEVVNYSNNKKKILVFIKKRAWWGGGKNNNKKKEKLFLSCFECISSIFTPCNNLIDKKRELKNLTLRDVFISQCEISKL